MRTICTLLLLFLIEIPSLTSSRATHSYHHSPNMDEICGKIIRLNGDTFPGTFFRLTSGKYEENLHCLLTIRAATRNQRIILVMDQMDVKYGDRLLIYDGKQDPRFLLNPDESLQSGTEKSYFRTTQSNTVVIEFLSNDDGQVGHGFTLNTAIDFPVSSCSQGEGLYRCVNGYCISNLFKCDGRNWCGDNSQDIACR